jgi:hydrogenase maturation protease
MSSAGEPRRVVVIGVGNRWRHDDAAGLEVVRRLRERSLEAEIVEAEGEPIDLMDAWRGADAVLVIDAVSSGASAGTLHRIDVSSAAVPATLTAGSTHTLGIAETVELARALGRLPRRAVLYGIEGANFHAGRGLSAEVERAVADVVARVREDVTPR